MLVLLSSIECPSRIRGGSLHHVGQSALIRVVLSVDPAVFAAVKIEVK